MWFCHQTVISSCPTSKCILPKKKASKSNRISISNTAHILMDIFSNTLPRKDEKEICLCNDFKQINYV